ncbi:uncharacterized protein si:dkey-15h8.17 isoform X1 [Silurus meridionalis]|uniref:uncharacterized protein si:dkey-15h8.17 isoform X1 n=1 Tax=Silurus meridionalis TaxID=175797 RepID=UPI001EEC4A33|nr:uncharacterized protein si:dkey-15h8.17 isoform X1 [Silurus meridionalis]XP_046691614.1 uncharacterized protein si:dkey-15h8.17 isoform X1 [Silurus meridionalis]XP_046691616.1 uncharacterized protein si:dkey-15h8.17 isoform X1 [Silurus meridionalis]
MDEVMLKELVLSFLPGLSDETLTSLLNGLQELGVENKEDLALVQEKDIVKYIRPIQCRKLLHGFKGLEIVQLELFPVTSPTFAASTLNTPCTIPVRTQDTISSSSSQLGKPWHADFQVNWDRMPAAIARALANKTRPSPSDRKDMVKAVVDQMLEHDSNPSRAICHNIVRSIVRSHANCFADVAKNGDILGDGCYSLLQQIKTRVEYKNRNNTLVRRRRERRPQSKGANEGMIRGPVDQYGCVRWSPVEFPPGETEASLHAMKSYLLDIYSEEGIVGAERAEPLMEKTYVIQRRYLNSMPAPAIAVVMERWPYLFSLKGIFSHFTLLTDVPILMKLRKALDKNYNTILKFFQGVNYQGVKDVLATFEPEASDKTAIVLLLLMAYFKEPKDSIVLDVDPFATATDIERTVTLPSTPCLIVQGDTLTPRAWMLSLEGQVVMGPHPDFTTGLAATFASYYNFNLKYADSGSCTLEFIQRRFLGINPETGTKSKKQKGLINQQVCTLIRKLIDFEWMSV